MRYYWEKLKLLLAFSTLFIVLSLVALSQSVTAEASGTTAASFVHTPTDYTLASTGTNPEYISPVFTPTQSFNGVGITWEGTTPTADVQFALRVDDSDWIELEPIVAEGKSNSTILATAPVFLSGKTIQYRLQGVDRKLVKAVRLTYFDSTIPPEVSPIRQLSSFIHSTVATTDTTIVSRADWGADESYRTWEPDYTTVKKILIHHTAGGTGGEDPAAVIRGIYYWHAVVLGWGDIGYNYLIDETGTVYEGRYGGDGVIGAHAYNSATQTNFNDNSVGIVLLGCYESTEGACAHPDTPTPEMLNALTHFITTTAEKFNIDPNGKSNWKGEMTKNILAHRDIDATYCPGDTVYQELQSIRSTASSSLAQATTDLSANLVSQNLASSYYTTDSPPTWTITYRNTSAETWESGTVRLKARFGKRKKVITLSEAVAPNDTVTITIPWHRLPRQPRSLTTSVRLKYHKTPVSDSAYQQVADIL